MSQFKSIQDKKLNDRQLYKANALYDPLRQQSEQEKFIYSQTKISRQNISENPRQSHDIFLVKQDQNLPIKGSSKLAQQKLQTQFSDRKSYIFDKQSVEAENQEQQWKPLVKKHEEKETPSYDISFKRQLKTVDVSKQEKFIRDPIIQGQQKLEYQRKRKADENARPQDQLKLF